MTFRISFSVAGVCALRKENTSDSATGGTKTPVARDRIVARTRSGSEEVRRNQAVGGRLLEELEERIRGLLARFLCGELLGFRDHEDASRGDPWAASRLPLQVSNRREVDPARPVGRDGAEGVSADLREDVEAGLLEERLFPFAGRSALLGALDREVPEEIRVFKAKDAPAPEALATRRRVCR